MASVLNQPFFRDEEAAYAKLESIVWPSGATCPHCGSTDRMKKMGGAATRVGLYKCYACRKQSRVTVGTVFESSHIKLHMWLQAMYLLCSSKKGISSNQIARTLGVTVKTAWFMSHRLREAMRDGKLPIMGGPGSVVEADETFIGRLADVPKQRGGTAHKNAVLTLVERGGSARSFHIDNASIANIIPIVKEHVALESTMMTDTASHYRRSLRAFAGHETVNHYRDGYVRGSVHTNTVEGFYSIFKRGRKGIYQHCSEKHLHRYLAEFDFRYSNRVQLGVDDVARTVNALRGIVGKRLTYRSPSPPGLA